MIISGVAAKRRRARSGPVLPQQGMLRRRPYARDILDGEHEHAQPVEELQAGAVARGDVGHGLRHGRGDVAEDEPDQHPVDDARGGLPAPSVLQDLEGALAREARALGLGVHRIVPSAWGGLMRHIENRRGFAMSA